MTNTDALQQILFEQEDWLRALARRLIWDPALAEDAVQEAWVAALTNPPTELEPSRMRPWLAGIVRNKVFGELRSKSRRRQQESEILELKQTEPSSDERTELIELVLESVATLSPSERELVQMRYFRELQPRQIARELDVTAPVVRNRLNRAVHKLRIELDRRFGQERRAFVALLIRLAEPTGAPLRSAVLVAVLALAGVFVAVTVPDWDLADPPTNSPGSNRSEVVLTPAASSVESDDSQPLLDRTVAEPDETPDEALPGTWIEGVVVVPEGTPPDDSLVVRMVEPVEDEAQFSVYTTDPRAEAAWLLTKPWSELERAVVRWVNGQVTFRLKVPDDRSVVFLKVDGRYLYSPSAHRVEVRPDEANPVELQPLCGAHVDVRFERSDGLPLSLTFESDPKVMWLAAPDCTWIDRQIPSFSRDRLRLGRISSEGTFEVRALPTGVSYWIGMRSQSLGLRTREMPPLHPGQSHVVRIEVDLDERASGRVMDEVGRGVAGVDLRLQGGCTNTGYLFPPLPSFMNLETATDATGAFDFPRQPINYPCDERDPIQGKVSWASIVAKHPEYPRASMWLKPGTDDFQLSFAVGQTSVGVVRWPDGSPASKVNVEVFVDRIAGGVVKPVARAEVQTDTSGRFEVTGLSQGTLAIRVVAEREGPGESDQPEFGWAYERGLSANQELAIELRPAGRIQGRVLQADGTPVRSFTVLASPIRDPLASELESLEPVLEAQRDHPQGFRLDRPRQVHGDDFGGYFEIDGLPGDLWRLHVQAPGHAISEPNVVWADSGEDVEIVLRPGRDVEGVVVDPEGRPQPNAFVLVGYANSYWESTNLEVTPELSYRHTDGRGRFVVSGARPGPLQIRARLPGFGPSAPLHIAAVAGWPDSVPDDLEPVEAVVPLRPAARLRGRVHSPEGVGQSPVYVRLAPEDESEARKLFNEPDGTFVFEDLAPVRYEVQVSAAGYVFKTLTVDLTFDPDQEIAIELPAEAPWGTTEVSDDR